MKADRDKVVAWMIEKKLECPRCGTRLDEWDDDKHAYVASPYLCPGCEHLDWSVESAREQGTTKGLHFRLLNPHQVRMLEEHRRRKQQELDWSEPLDPRRPD